MMMPQCAVKTELAASEVRVELMRSVSSKVQVEGIVAVLGVAGCP